jgi:DNA-binding SARP family transcriptional activator/tetratricopeptide (TPR) repeat protein
LPGQLEVAVLGPVRAWTDGRPVRLGTARQRTVFAVLVAAAGRIVTPAELIAAVWGASPPAAARDNLYTYVSGLRRSLPGDALESEAAGYRLPLAAGARDADRFVALVGEAVARQEGGDRAGAATLLGDALRLWRGEAYAGCEGERFDVDRAHLGRLRLDAIERRAGLLIGLGDDDVVAELAGLVREHPLHEPFHRLLMEALHRAGRTAEALTAFRAARDVLAAELGTAPGAALRELHERIVARDDRSGRAGELLRLAVLLGPEFRADALIVASGRPAAEVLDQIDNAQGPAWPGWAEAVARNIPGPERIRLRRRLAEALAGLGAPIGEVAAQLTAEPPEFDAWLLSWTVAHLAELTEQEPRAAVRLGRMALDSGLPSSAERAALLSAYATADFRLGGRPEAEVRQALELAGEPASRAAMRHLLAEIYVRAGDAAAAAAQLVDDPRTPPIWRTRHRTLLARLGRAGPPYDEVAELQARWRAYSDRGDHRTALRHADRALDGHPADPEIRLDLLDIRVFSLQNLDRFDEAELSLQEAAHVGLRNRLAAPLVLASAEQDFLLGRRDDAIAKLSLLTDDSPTLGMFGRREQRAGVRLLHSLRVPERAAARAEAAPLLRANGHLAEASALYRGLGAHGDRRRLGAREENL